MIKWETDCTTQYSPEDWDVMLDNLPKCTTFLAVRGTAFKLLARWYYTPSKPVYLGVSEKCFHGCLLKGSLKHIFWDCEQLFPVLRKISSALLVTFPEPNNVYVPSWCHHSGDIA